MEEEKKIKVVLVGSQGCGKTSIVARMKEDTFDPDVNPTVGIDFVSLQNESIKFQLWDTSGLSRFKPLMPSYFKDSKLCVFVYSVDNRSSFDEILKYVGIQKDCMEDSKTVDLLIANKTDLDGRQVTTEEGEAFAAKHNMMYLEFSAKEGDKNILLAKLREATEKYETLTIQ